MDVIIPTTGKRQQSLLSCINSLSKQTQPVNIILVFSHNVKKEDTTQYLINFKNCTILYESYKKSKGSHRAIACNNGLFLSQSKYVAFLDDDVTVPPTWAESSQKYFKDPTVAGVTSGCIPSQSPFHLVQTIGSDAHSNTFTSQTPVESIPGYNSIYLRSTINSVGGFNEIIGGCEDWELNYRLRKAGWKLIGIPETPVDHRHTYTVKSFIKQMFGYGWSRSRLLKIRHIFTPQHAIPTIGLLTFIILPFLNIKIFEIALVTYIITLTALTFLTKPDFRIPNSFSTTFFTFIIMHVSWALGYLKGLIS